MKKIAVAALVISLLVPAVLQAHEGEWWNAQEFKPVIQSLCAPYEEESAEHRECVGDVEDVFSDMRVEWYPNLPQLLPRKSEDVKSYSDFLNEESFKLGRVFLRSHPRELSEVEEDYGVPREVLAAILRIETKFGKNTGEYQAFGVFASLIKWEHDARKVANARKQLIALFEVAEIIRVHPLEIKGSYAGCFGLPQFIPVSFLHYRADGNHDGEVDLYNLQDALASKANYLVRHNFEENPRNAVYAYNHDRDYVDFVFDYAKALGWSE